MDIATAQSAAFRMSQHVSWIHQKKMMQGPVKKSLFARPAVKVTVPVETKPAEEKPVVPVEEPKASLPPVEVRKMTTEEVIAEWRKPVDDANRGTIELEILRRCRKHARKIKAKLPEGKCEGDNVIKFIEILETK